MWGLTLQRGSFLSDLLYPLRPLFECATCKANQVVLWNGTKQASRCVVSEVFWKGVQCSPILALPVRASQLPRKSHKDICAGCCLWKTWRYVCMASLLTQVSYHHYCAWGNFAKGSGPPRYISTCQLPLRLTVGNVFSGIWPWLGDLVLRLPLVVQP